MTDNSTLGLRLVALLLLLVSYSGMLHLLCLWVSVIAVMKS